MNSTIDFIFVVVTPKAKNKQANKNKQTNKQIKKRTINKTKINK
jgi:hypothetical protein